MGKAKVKKLAKQLVSRLKDLDINVNRIILFGSHASGRARPYSDIDIAVVSSSFEGKGLLRRQELLGEAIYPLQEPIEALGYTLREYRNVKPASFLSEIISNGKVIYSN